MDKNMEKGKEGITEDVLVALKNYIEVTSKYSEEFSDNKPLYRICFMLDKMEEELDKLKPYYDVLC
ncbi:hypothetical protein J6G99_08745 [bacterium]|nr:hypothetical protein [bacterium]